MSEINTNKETGKNASVPVARSVSGQSVLTLIITRNSTVGLQIELSSPIDWRFLYSPNGKILNVGGVKCFQPRTDRVPEVDSRFYTDDVYEYDGNPNLIMLLAQDIKNGVTFNFGHMPISPEKTNQWAERLYQDVKILYLKYCKPFQMKVRITTETIENEEHN